MIQLRLLNDDDRIAIEHWPPYPHDFRELDYALRSGGWLYEYRDRPETWIFAVEDTGDLIGFTILSKTGVNDAEFRIALRGDKTGVGLGSHITVLTLEKGFSDMGLGRIHLIVREKNPRAASVYRGLGFIETGTYAKSINGKEVVILAMELGVDTYRKGR